MYKKSPSSLGTNRRHLQLLGHPSYSDTRTSLLWVGRLQCGTPPAFAVAAESRVPAGTHVQQGLDLSRLGGDNLKGYIHSTFVGVSRMNGPASWQQPLAVVAP